MPRTMEKILAYKWPGNIRELMNAIERAVVLARSNVLDEHEIELIMGVSNNDAGAVRFDKVKGNLSLEDIERKSILDTLDACSGNKSETARRLGITRKTLRAKLDKYKDIDK